MNLTGKVLYIAACLSHCKNTQNRNTNTCNRECDKRNKPFAAGHKPEQRRKDKISGAKKHCKECKADNDTVSKAFLHSRPPNIVIYANPSI